MNDIEILARTLFGEALALDTDDAEAIACAVLSRVGYRNWPSTIGAVCLQPKQFSCWNHDDPNRARILQADRTASKWFDKCWTIAERAASGSLKDPTRTSTHYHTRAVSPYWSKGKTPVFETKGHVFFNNIDTPAPTSAKEALDQERPLAQTRTVVGDVIAGGATIAGVVYGSAQEVITEAAQAVAPLSSLFDGNTIKFLLAGIALGGILMTLYARWDDRNKGIR